MRSRRSRVHRRQSRSRWTILYVHCGPSLPILAPEPHLSRDIMREQTLCSTTETCFNSCDSLPRSSNADSRNLATGCVAETEKRSRPARRPLRPDVTQRQSLQVYRKRSQRPHGRMLRRPGGTEHEDRQGAETARRA